MHGYALPTARESVRAQHRDLIEGLIALKPKKRSLVVHWIIVAGLASVIGGLGTDASVREAMFSPKVAARAPQFAATVSTPRSALPAALVSVPAYVTPVQAMAAAPIPPEVVDAPLPHAKAHHTQPTTRAHSRQRRAK